MSRRVALFVAAAVVASLLLPRPAAVVAVTDVASPGCTNHCGNISIPYPFGVEPGCYLPGFNVTCRNDSSVGHHGSPKLFLGDGTVEVLEISIANATVRINASLAYFPGTGKNNFLGPKPITTNATWSGALGKGGVYTLGWRSNRLFAIGCNVQVLLLEGGDGDPNNKTLSTCATFCDWDEQEQSWSFPGISDCSGIFCCQANILVERSSYGFKVLSTNGVQGPTSEAMVWIVDSDLDFYEAASSEGSLPAVLDWRINHTTCHGNGSSAACRSSHSFCEYMHYRLDEGHICSCTSGYQGNPYIPNGCKDIDECAHPELHTCYGVCINMPGTFHCRCKQGTYGDPFTKGGCSSLSVLKIGLAVGGGTVFLLLAIGAPFVARKIKQHKVKKTKQRFFKQNHGLLLQQLVSQKSDIGERMIITLGELEKATNNFDPSHEVGGGGHGIVYKGLLDLQVVAIKKSKIIVQKEIDDFINEVAILSQINHRNIVKLLGCCLETEVPLLVYEFISNGTLAHHLHVEGNISLPWDDRMRIALETSKALAYLHSAASTPVLHRDIKSSNILLDDNLTAKVSDFGASRHISIDQTGVTTAIQGTIGYLDPMYYYTSRLTDKSDVFSFGVLLIELLTRKRPTVRTSDGDSLVSHFASLVTEGDLVGIIDPQIMEEAEVEKVEEVAKLAAMCTKLNGEDRPTMREVEMTLENLRTTKKHTRHNIATKRYEKDQTAAPYISFEGLTMEASRQYTMEEEMLLSGTYPR
ncbi:wall-associated receptor kinase 1-like [Miscanthus floridulus]|uniref:wall-associated receptor kinase 1-like n=1 Tax=Miscanthus floridulus TaxID=154761 RepID=UPI0034587C52